MRRRCDRVADFGVMVSIMVIPAACGGRSGVSVAADGRRPPEHMRLLPVGGGSEVFSCFLLIVDADGGSAVSREEYRRLSVKRTRFAIVDTSWSDFNRVRIRADRCGDTQRYTIGLKYGNGNSLTRAVHLMSP